MDTVEEKVRNKCGDGAAACLVRANMLRQGLAACADTWLDLIAGIIFVNNGHTGWGALTFTIWGLNALAGGYLGFVAGRESSYALDHLGCLNEEQKVRAHGRSFREKVITPCGNCVVTLLGLLNMTPLAVAIVPSSKSESSDRDEEQHKLVDKFAVAKEHLAHLLVVEAFLEAQFQVLVQLHALLVDHLEAGLPSARRITTSTTEQAELWVSVSLSVVTISGALFKIRTSGIPGGDAHQQMLNQRDGGRHQKNDSSRWRMFQRYRLFQGILMKLFVFVQAALEVLVRVFIISIFAVAFKGGVIITLGLLYLVVALLFLLTASGPSWQEGLSDMWSYLLLVIAPANLLGSFTPMAHSFDSSCGWSSRCRSGMFVLHTVTIGIMLILPILSGLRQDADDSLRGDSQIHVVSGDGMLCLGQTVNGSTVVANDCITDGQYAALASLFGVASCMHLYLLAYDQPDKESDDPIMNLAKAKERTQEPADQTLHAEHVVDKENTNKENTNNL